MANHVAAGQLDVDNARNLIGVEYKSAIPLMILYPERQLLSFVGASAVISLSRLHPIAAGEVGRDGDLIEVSLSNDWLNVVNIVQE